MCEMLLVVVEQATLARTGDGQWVNLHECVIRATDAGDSLSWAHAKPWCISLYCQVADGYKLGHKRKARIQNHSAIAFSAKMLRW
jgi:hypothetical protein